MIWNESDDDFAERHFQHWCDKHEIAWTNGVYKITHEELKRIHQRAVDAFNEACEKLEKEEGDAKIRHLLTTTLGRGTYMVEEN